MVTRTEKWLWIYGVATYGVLDVALTRAAVGRAGTAVEANPVAREMMESLGVDATLAAGKTFSLGLLLAAWYFGREETEVVAVGVPATVAVLGTLVALGNARVLAQLLQS